MQLETTVMLCDWLAGTPAVGKGVNDFLATVPRLPGDAVPPALVTVADCYRDEKCSAWFIGTDNPAPPRLNALYVTPEGPIDAEGEVGPVFRTCRSVSVVVRVIVGGSNRTLNARLAEYYREAIGLSVDAWLADDEDGRSGRRLGPVYVVAANRRLTGPWGEDVGAGAMALGVVALDLEVRRHNPS